MVLGREGGRSARGWEWMEPWRRGEGEARQDATRQDVGRWDDTGGPWEVGGGGGLCGTRWSRQRALAVGGGGDDAGAGDSDVNRRTEPPSIASVNIPAHRAGPATGQPLCSHAAQVHTQAGRRMR
jgi:hypothetical protein